MEAITESEKEEKIRALSKEISEIKIRKMEQEWLLEVISLQANLSSTDLNRIEILRKLTTAFPIKRPAERIRVAAKLGEKISKEVSIDSVFEYSTFVDALKPLIKKGSIAGAPVSKMENEDFFNWFVEVTHKSALWARAGMNEIQISEGLATALLLTEVPELDQGELHLPFNAFVMRLPQGLIPFFVPDSDEQQWAQLAWVFRYGTKFGPRIRWIVDWNGLAVVRDTEEDFLTLKDAGDEIAEQDQIALDAVFRLVRNFMLWLSDRGGLRKEDRPSVPKAMYEKRKHSNETWPTSWLLGQEVVLEKELKKAAVEMLLGRSKRHRVDGWEIRTRFTVRGHWRNQSHGPRSTLRRRQWIMPFWKGPEKGEAFAHIYKSR